MGEVNRPDDPDEKDSLSAAAVEASPIAILMTDDAGRIVLANPAAEDLSRYRRRVRLVKQYDEVPRIRGDASGLRRVFFNLLTNAFESIPEDGSEQNQVGLATWADPDGFAVIEVRDTGRGIPPETVDRIFEPFFTTKTSGVRTGLGLAVARGIVNSMGGEIEVTSALGKGSSFRVKLPATPSADSPRSPLRGAGAAATKLTRQHAVRNEPGLVNE